MLPAVVISTRRGRRFGDGPAILGAAGSASAVVATLALALGAPATAAPRDATLPRPAHVVIVVEENHSFEQIVGNPEAKYINSLIARGALLTRSYGVAHPSEPNYLALFCGSTLGLSSDACPVVSSLPNLGNELIAAGLSFTGYAMSMPRDGWTGCAAGGYARKHVPWADFRNVPPSSSLTFRSFPTDFDTLPTVAMVVPDLAHDMHDGKDPVKAGDDWLRHELDAYVQWAQTHDSLLVLTWDEDDKDSGNHIATILVGPMVKHGQFGRHVTHYDVLRTIEDMYGLPPTGLARTAHALTDVWVTPVVTSAAAVAGVVGRPFHHDLIAQSDTAVTWSADAGFPADLALSGSAIVGVPQAAGTFVAGVSATNDAGATTQRLALVFDADADGDGWPDPYETALGSDPADAAATPTGFAATAGVLDVSRLRIRLDFAAAAGDDVTLVADLPAGTRLSAARGTRLVIAAGDAVRAFARAGAGRYVPTAAGEASSCRVTHRKGRLRVTVRIRGALADAFAGAQLTDETVAGRETAAIVRVVAGDAAALAAVPLTWSAAQGVSGTARSR